MAWIWSDTHSGTALNYNYPVNITNKRKHYHFDIKKYLHFDKNHIKMVFFSTSVFLRFCDIKSDILYMDGQWRD